MVGLVVTSDEPEASFILAELKSSSSPNNADKPAGVAEFQF